MGGGLQDGYMVLTLSDGRILRGHAENGVFTYRSDESPVEVDVQVTVNEQANGRCHRAKKAAKK